MRVLVVLAGNVGFVVHRVLRVVPINHGLDRVLGQDHIVVGHASALALDHRVVVTQHVVSLREVVIVDRTVTVEPNPRHEAHNECCHRHAHHRGEQQPRLRVDDEKVHRENGEKNSSTHHHRRGIA